MARSDLSHLLPSCSLAQHVWFTPKNGNAVELCTTEKKCHEQTYAHPTCNVGRFAI